MGFRSGQKDWFFAMEVRAYSGELCRRCSEKRLPLVGSLLLKTGSFPRCQALSSGLNHLVGGLR